MANLQREKERRELRVRYSTEVTEKILRQRDCKGYSFRDHTQKEFHAIVVYLDTGRITKDLPERYHP